DAIFNPSRLKDMIRHTYDSIEKFTETYEKASNQILTLVAFEAETNICKRDCVSLSVIAACFCKMSEYREFTAWYIKGEDEIIAEPVNCSKLFRDKISEFIH